MAAGSAFADSDVTFPSPSPTPAPALAPAPSPAPSSQETSSASMYFRSPSAATGPSHRDNSNDRDRDHSNRGNRGGPSGDSDCKSASKGGGDDGGSYETPEELLHRRRTTGSCSFYPNKFKECAEPRNCFDCLNFVVEGVEGGCMLSDWGKCVPARKYYNETMDFSRYKPSNANESASVSASSRSSSSGSYMDNSVKLPPPKDERYNFLADKAEYCAKNDPQCTVCRRSVFADYIEDQTDRGRAAFCFGENGCVCIAVCEARMAHPQPPPKDCFAKALAAKEKGENKKGGGDSGWAAVSAVLGAMIFVMVTVFAIYRIRSKGERRSRTESVGNSSSSGGGANGAGGVDSVNVVATPESNSSPSNTTMVTVTSTTAGSRLLNLFGWQAMRDDLINKEHMRFAGVEPTSPVKHSNVQFLGVEPSAPEIDSAVPTAPMAAMAIPVPMAMMAASAPMVFSVRAMASAPDFEDMDDEYEVL